MDSDDFFPIKTLEQISDQADESISLMKSQFSMQEVEIDIAGIAKTRDDLLAFKNSLEEFNRKYINDETGKIEIDNTINLAA